MGPPTLSQPVAGEAPLSNHFGNCNSVVAYHASYMLLKRGGKWGVLVLDRDRRQR